MENEKKKFKIKKIEFHKKRFKIKKIEYYEELDEVNQKINNALTLIGMRAMLITVMSLDAYLKFKLYGLRLGIVSEIGLSTLNFAAIIIHVIKIVEGITQKTTLKAKIEGLNDLLNAEEPKKLVLSKNGENRGFRR